jgi:CubicO group peptidase (beta-lactamase class C family)
MKISASFALLLLSMLVCGLPSRTVSAVSKLGEAHSEQQLLARWDNDEHRDLKAVVVLRDGELIAERYYNGDGTETLHDIRSAGKSITALLIGIAIDQKKIRATSDRVGLYLPEIKSKPIGAISIADLLTMRSGLDANDEDPASPGNEDRMDQAADPARFALDIAVANPPGTRYIYNSLTAYLAGLVVERAVDLQMDDFAREFLFQPLGINAWRWDRDAAGHTKGQGNLFLTARDFAKIGQMVLNRGMYGGQRVLSERWIAQMLKPRVAIGTVDPYADHYGYLWYSRTHDIQGKKVLVYFASGNGGNKIYLVPSRRLVVAITSSAYGQRHGQRRSEAILKTLLAAPDEARDSQPIHSANQWGVMYCSV